MADGPESKPGDASRQRPVHWDHPVDESLRQRRARRHRRRQVGLLAAAAVLVCLVGLYAYLTSDERVEQFAETYLESLLGTHVGIERAGFSLTDGLVLEGLTVSGPAPFREPVLVADKVDLKLDALALARFRLDVTEMVLHRPLISLVLWNEEEWNFQALARARPPDQVAPAVLPRFVLTEGTVRIRRKVEGVTLYEHAMQVSGLLLPSESDPDTFRFQTDVTSAQVHLAVASGRLNVRTGSLQLEGQASNVVLSPDLHESLPAEAQRVWDRFQPTGSVNLKVLFDERRGLRLMADLTGVDFAYEYQGVASQFRNLTGRCTFSPTSLELSGVQGLVNGSPIRRADGRVWGFDAQRLALDLSIRVDQVDLEETRALVEAMAPHLGALYRIFEPKGRADVDLQLQTPPDAGPDARPRVSGVVYCRDVQATYLRFPYRLDRLRGAVRFDPEGFQTDGLSGDHDGAPVWLAAVAKNPGPLVDAHVKVRAEGLPLDEDLRAALSDAQREVYDQYAPSGRVDIEADIRREPERDARPKAVVTGDLRGCRLKYEAFPYEITDAVGRVVLAPDRTEIHNLVGRHGEAEVALNGEILAQQEGPPRVRLDVAGRNVPLDDDLELALPPEERRAIQVFHLAGLADVSGTVTRGPETANRRAYDLAVDLKGARMIYEEFPFLAEDVTGRLRVASGVCRIESLSGTNAGARLTANGWIEHRPDDYAMDIQLEGEDVLLDERLRGAFGQGVRAAWRHLRPNGRVDMKAHLVKDFGQGETVRHHVWVTARDAQATLDVFPYPLEHVQGVLEFEGDEVRLHDVKARSGLSSFVLSGRVLYARETPDVDLQIRAETLRLEGPVRRALPEPLQRAMAWLRPTGRMDVTVPTLRYREIEPGVCEGAWSASAVLDDVQLSPGIRVAGVVGTADVEGRWLGGDVDLVGRLWIQQGKVADKDVSNMRLAFEKRFGSQVLMVRRIEGEFYGGRVEGSGQVNLTPGARYGLQLAATGVDFERLLRDGFRLESDVTGGRLRATMAVRSAGRDGAPADASGYAYVTDARLYELPPVLRVLAAMRLAPAEQAAFRNAQIQYYVRGGRIFLTDIRLEGRALNLFGAGTIEQDGRMALSFMTGKKDDDPLVPALADLMDGLRHELAVVEVGGTLAEPEVQVRSLKSLTAPLRELVALVREQRRSEGR